MTPGKHDNVNVDEGGQTSTGSSITQNKQDSFSLQIPSVSLPKGGGALKNIDEKFQVNAANGTASFSIPLPFSKARSDLMPNVSLSYNSGNGNGWMGLGWNCDMPSIQRKTDKRLPEYNDAKESDVFLFGGMEDLVPRLKQDNGGNWIADEFTAPSGEFVKRYRPRIDASFMRIERITPAGSAVFYWRTTSPNNIVTIYGRNTAARIANPSDKSKIFKWLPELTFDDRGNCFEYEYVPEDFVSVERSLYEQNRLNNNSPCANTYLKRIRYGNTNPYSRNAETAYNPAIPANPGYMFETVFDFGDHDENIPTPVKQNDWPSRLEPFSDFHSGFEIRTYRLCRRILFFHYFKELNDGVNTAPCLVKSLDMSYQLFLNSAATPSEKRNAEADYIVSLQQSGYIKKQDGSYSKKSLPPFDFSYQPLSWNTSVENVSKESLTNDPVGLSASYQWTDLYSEGISGILTEQANAWFYKSNLGNGNFTEAIPVIPKPSFTGLQNNGLHLQELEADGRKFIVSLQSDVKGYFELTGDNEWLPFQSFDQVPNINFNDPDTKVLDLDGDGRPDVIISEENVFTWYPSKGMAGYDSPEIAPKPYDEEKGPALVFADPLQGIFISDMNGDGLADIVRIRNGDICYWPNMGYGKFGAKVTMSFAPVFDTQDQFNPAYLHLGDISGTGATDIIYCGKNLFRAWINCAGNFWGDEQVIDFPTMEQPNQVAVMDFLGNGTACIVWSSPLPKYTVTPMRYIDLMGGNKPYLLNGYKNNFGKEITWQYKSSTHYYLQDKTAGKPWITKLPFPVQCIGNMIMRDAVAGTVFTNSYSYHHGYYDYLEREFRGFGRVEQLDTEDFTSFVLSNANNVVEDDLHQAPVKTITWFHTGAYFDQQKIFNQFEEEYNKGPFEFDLPASVLPDDLIAEEIHEALRACKNIVLRRETYSTDGSTDESKPYSISTHNCIIKLLQPKLANRYAVFLSHESETLNIYYERNLADPRITHQLNIEVDDFGSVLQAATVAYARKVTDAKLPAAIQTEQRQTHIVYNVNGYTNGFDLPDTYRLEDIAETKAFELTNNVYNAVTQFTITGLSNDFSAAATIQYEDKANGSLQKRLIKDVQTIYLNNDLKTLLSLSQQDTLGFRYQSFKLAFTPSLITNIYGSKLVKQNLIDAKYVQQDGVNWWIASGKNIYLQGAETISDAQQRFYLPVAVHDACDIETKLTYDTYHLSITQTEDAVQNVATVETFDYRILQPTVLKDMNDNISEVIADELAMIIATSVYGDESNGNHGDEPLTSYTIIQPANVAEVVTNPIKFLQKATTFFYYDLFAWINSNQPASFTRVVRETHESELTVGNQTKTFIRIGYSNGLGQTLQTKIQAEPGEAFQWQGNNLVTIDTTPNLRWVGNGRTIVNNKGNPVKQFEPFFSTTFEFENDDAVVEIGFSSIFYYDALSRAIRIEHANGTFTRTEFDAWQQLLFDENDTVLDSQWYADRGSPNPLNAEPADPEQRAAWLSAKHANTPTQQHVDSLGRTIYTIADNGSAGKYATQTILDIKNNQLAIIDARNNVVMQYDYDMASRRVHQVSMDGGERFAFNDALDKPVYAWDGMNHRFHSEYDLVHRPSNQWLIEDVTKNLTEKLIGLIIYGENQSLNGKTDKQLNLRGKAFQVYDQSGLAETTEYDFKSNLKSSFKQLASDYKNIVDLNVANKNSLLETQTFKAFSRFDAVNRPVEVITPDNSKISPVYNEANLLEQLHVFIQSQNKTVAFVQNIDYNAKAQRTNILYGNNTATKYEYDEKTYELTRLLTTRNNGADILQDLHYTFDPVKNITAISDAAQQTTFFNNAAVDPSMKYEYDAIYRLIYSQGREHAGANAASDQFDSDKTSFNNQRLTLPGDMNAMQRYEEKYDYDEVGNMLRMIHNAGNGIFSNKWTRTFSPDANNNCLAQTQVGANITTYNYDAHGNLQNLQNGTFSLTWNYANELQHVDLGGGGTAYYVYDSNGNRVRKIIENGNLIKQRIYLNAYEVYRESTNGIINLERQTIHILDDKQRIALVETRTIGEDKGLQFLIRYQYTNHIDTACLELDDNAAIISYEEYYPFGSTAYQAMRNQTETSKRYRYTGKERDEESGLYYHGARYYACWLCRWISPDPAGIADHINRYVYAKNNPVRFIDTTGTDSTDTKKQKEVTKQADKNPDSEKAAAKPKEPTMSDPETGDDAKPKPGEQKDDKKEGDDDDDDYTSYLLTIIQGASEEENKNRVEISGLYTFGNGLSLTGLYRHSWKNVALGGAPSVTFDPQGKITGFSGGVPFHAWVKDTGPYLVDVGIYVTPTGGYFIDKAGNKQGYAGIQVLGVASHDYDLGGGKKLTLDVDLGFNADTAQQAADQTTLGPYGNYFFGIDLVLKLPGKWQVGGEAITTVGSGPVPKSFDSVSTTRYNLGVSVSKVLDSPVKFIGVYGGYQWEKDTHNQFSGPTNVRDQWSAGVTVGF